MLNVALRASPTSTIVRRKPTIRFGLSARNQLKGVVTSLKLGGAMAVVAVNVGGQKVVSAITRGSVELLGLAQSQPVVVGSEATEVLIGVE